MRATITDAVQVAGLWMYAWEQVETNFTTGLDQQPLAYNRGTTTVNPAVEINNTSVPVGTVVEVKQRGYVAGALWWEFAHEEGGGSSFAVTHDEIGITDTLLTSDGVPTVVASLTFPGPGLYWLYGTLSAVGNVTSLGVGAPRVEGRVTGFGAIPTFGQTFEVINVTVANVTVFNTMSFGFPVPVPTGTPTVNIEVQRIGGVTWSVCEVLGFPNGYANIFGWFRLADS